jgi:ADP-ribose pyrophosphatase
MPKKDKAVKAVAPKKAKAAVAKKALKPKTAKAVKSKATKAAKALKPKVKKVVKTKKAAKTPVAAVEEKAQILSSEVVFDGPLFKIVRDKLIEPGGAENVRDVIRHNGSVVILAVDSSRSKKDPWIVVERQYRHAANQFLWELPAGKLEEGEEAVAGAKRELGEETGYQAKKWKPLVEYFASPGFLGESMKVFLAEGLVAGEAHPEADENIELRLVKLSEVLKMIAKGAILDGKTLTSVLLYARQTAAKRAK